jgi:hypothetical protein
MISFADAPHLEILSKNAMTCAKLKQFARGMTVPNALNKYVSYGFEVTAFTFLRVLWHMKPLKSLSVWAMACLTVCDNNNNNIFLPSQLATVQTI